jgi:hypothetical protein
MANNDVLDNVLDPIGQPTGIFGAVSDPDHERDGVVLNPDLQPTQSVDAMKGQMMADRLDTLDGKLVYLVETGFHGAKAFNEQVAAWFGRNMPEVKTVQKSTKGMIFTPDPELWAEIEEKGDAVILGVGG